MASRGHLHPMAHGPTLSRPRLLSAHLFWLSSFPLLLLRTLVITKGPSDNPGESPYLRILNLIIGAESLLPLVTYSQVLGIKIRIFSFEEEEDFIQSPQCPSWMHAVTTVWAKALQSCPTLCNPVDCSLPGSSVHGILQARILEGVAVPSSRGASRPREDVCSHHSSLPPSPMLPWRRRVSWPVFFRLSPSTSFLISLKCLLCENLSC